MPSAAFLRTAPGCAGGFRPPKTGTRRKLSASPPVYSAQQPQPLLQPQLLLQQQLLLPLPQQQNRMMIRMMIHRQPPPPQPLLQHPMTSTSYI